MIFFCGIVDDHVSAGREKKAVISEDLLARIGNNDMAAFEELYRKTERSIYTYALSFLKNHDDALDVMQDTYLKIRAAAHLYEPMGKPMSWVFTIVRNLSMSKLRLKNRTDDMQVEDIENDLSFSYITNHEDKLVLRAAFKVLNEQERQIILLHAVSGFKHIEISKYLGIPLSTVLSKYYRGLKKLRKHLMEQEVL
ncbi:ECF RNA polymerase sigma factor SigK [bioreactor metagenome]|uniref:ECF RNA polymerase sigma factor SigK n=1 Tax=bioreactor metagenome TaxID=1076179 RepID=A0A644X0A7_9ZZZZ